ncbi:MAG: site-specific integrase [Leptospira sp.]|nr:site-specific integrase [Leptospira sp.]
MLKNLIQFPIPSSNLVVDLNSFCSPFYSNEEIRKVLYHFRKHNFDHYLIVKYLFTTGASIPDLIHFRMMDFNYEESFLTLQARSRLGFRKISLEKEFAKELYRHGTQYSVDSPIFPGRNGNREERSIQKILKKASILIAKEITIPTIRDSIALSFFQSGISVPEIQTYLGHRSQKSTRYRIQSQQYRLKDENFSPMNEKAA